MNIATGLLFAQGHFATPEALRAAGLLDEPVASTPASNSCRTSALRESCEALRQLGQTPHPGIAHGWS